MPVRLAFLLVLAGLAGCLEPEAPVSGEADGEQGCCGPPGTDGDAGDRPVATLEFQPDVLALKRDFCEDQAFELPAPRFSSLRIVGVEDRLYEGPMRCTIILDPGRTDEERNQTSVFLDVVEVSSSGVGFAIESYSTAMFGGGAVYGSLDFAAPEGPWGAAGAYGIGYDPREEEQRIVATMARLMQAPDG